MWCLHCQADVATEVAADGQSLLCTVCGTEVRKVFAPSLHPETRSARELLERWAAAELLEDAETPPPATPDEESASEVESPRPRPSTIGRYPAPQSAAGSAAPKSKPKFRIDAAHETAEVAGKVRTPEPTPHARPTGERAVAKSVPAEEELPPGYRKDQPHAALVGPHFDLAAALEPQQTAGKSESLWGQMLAYLGIGVLTIGTVLVLWGHFGNLPNYASSGWLVATAGQMLLFLGVVTLISGGMQQTTHEVTRRVEFIGERMIRIEHSAQELLSGPHFGRGARTERESTVAGRGEQNQGETPD